MRKDSSRELGRKATAWLATCFVVAGGITTCTVLSVTFWDDPRGPLAATAGGALAVFGLLWLMRERSKSQVSVGLLAWLFRYRQNAQHRVAYRLSRREKDVPAEQLGTNAPPSVERIREITEGANNWVPSDQRLQRA